jgi:hypothetical protein
MFSATSTLAVVALIALGNIMPQQRKIIHEVTGLSPITLGLTPMVLMMGTFLCHFSNSGGSFAPANQFPVAEATLDAPMGVQLFVVAALLGTFAAAIGSAEDEQSKKERKTVVLVRADRIAMRLACAAGFLGAYQIFYGSNAAVGSSSWNGVAQIIKEAGQWIPASPRAGFANSDVVVEVPEGIQLLVISALLFIFKMAVDSDDEEKEKDPETLTKVKLVSASRIALRFAVTAAFVGLAQCASSFSQMLPASSAEGFGKSETTLEIPESLQLLTVSALLFLFKIAISDADDTQEESKAKPCVQLIRPDAIAFRFALAAGFWGLLKMMSESGLLKMMSERGANLLQALPASSAEEFGNSETTLEVSAGVQLLIVSALLLVFKMAISDTDDVHEESKEEKKTAQVQLVRPDAIALRFALAAGFWGLLNMMSESGLLKMMSERGANLLQALPASPAEGFGKSETTLEVSAGVQLLIVSALLFVFKMAISDTDDVHEESKEEKKTAQVQLVRPDAIALRFALAAGFGGILKIMSDSGAMAYAASLSMAFPTSPTEGFGKSESTLDVPEGMQLLIISALIFVFRMAINDDDDAQEESKEKKQSKVNLLSAQAIAFRFSFAALVFGCLKLALGSNDSAGVSPWNGVSQAKQAMITGFMSLSQSFPASPREGFAHSAAIVEVPEGVQLLLVSALLLVFKIAIDSDAQSEHSDSSEVKEKPKVQLVSASGIAFRLAVASGTFGLGKLAAPAMTRSISAVMDSGDLLAKGGMLGASTALVLWSAHKQSQNAKI